jgi:hypothetical protein
VIDARQHGSASAWKCVSTDVRQHGSLARAVCRHLQVSPSANCHPPLLPLGVRRCVRQACTRLASGALAQTTGPATSVGAGAVPFATSHPVSGGSEVDALATYLRCAHQNSRTHVNTLATLTRSGQTYALAQHYAGRVPSWSTQATLHRRLTRTCVGTQRNVAPSPHRTGEGTHSNVTPSPRVLWVHSIRQSPCTPAQTRGDFHIIRATYTSSFPSMASRQTPPLAYLFGEVQPPPLAQVQVPRVSALVTG